MSQNSLERRQLCFDSMDAILADVKSLGQGKRNSLGLWVPPQIVEHVNYFILGSLDGFSFTASWFMRIFGKLIKRSALTKPLKPGFTLPNNMREAIPGMSTAWNTAAQNLHNSISRIEKGEMMIHPSPLFGKLTHEEWEQLHCRHAEMHFGFIQIVK